MTHLTRVSYTVRTTC